MANYNKKRYLAYLWADGVSMPKRTQDRRRNNECDRIEQRVVCDYDTNPQQVDGCDNNDDHEAQDDQLENLNAANDNNPGNNDDNNLGDDDNSRDNLMEFNNDYYRLPSDSDTISNESESDNDQIIDNTLEIRIVCV